MSTAPQCSEDDEVIRALRVAVAQLEDEGLNKLGPAAEAGVVERYIELAVPERSDATTKSVLLRAKVINPSTTDHDTSTSHATRPLIVLFFGGGCVAGSEEQLTDPGRHLAMELNAVVVLPSYRLAPQHLFPTAQLDGLNFLSALTHNAALLNDIGAAPSKGLLVGGVSAGATIAAVLSSQALLDPHKLAYPITGNLLCIPTFFFGHSKPAAQYLPLWTSRKENSAAPGYNSEDMQRINRSTKLDPESTLASPLNNVAGLDLSRMPPTYVQMGALDYVRDDGVVYAQCLRDAGVATRTDISDGLTHESCTILASDTCRRAVRHKVIGAARWLLQMSGGSRV